MLDTVLLQTKQEPVEQALFIYIIVLGWRENERVEELELFFFDWFREGVPIIKAGLIDICLCCIS